MTPSIVTLLLLGAVDPCAPVVAAPAADPAAAAEYRAVAEAEQRAGGAETAVIAWRKAAALDPDDRASRDALAAMCSDGAPKVASGDPLGDAIRLLDANRYREAAELLRSARRTRPGGADAALLEGICRYELGEDLEAARLLREAEADADAGHRATARLYLGLIALRAGSSREAAALFDSAAGSPSIASIATDLSRSARWEGPLSLSVLMEGGWDSNVTLSSSKAGGGGMASGGDAVGGLSAAVVGRPFGSNGLFVRAAGAYQKFARLDRYDFTSVEVGAGGRFWRGGTGITAEYSLADRTLGGDAYLLTHRLLATGAYAFGPVALGGSWWGRWEDYASGWAPYSGFAQRADGRVSVALGSRTRLGAGWAWGHDDADTTALGWTEQGPRADLRVVLGPTTRLAVEGGVADRRYAAYDAAYGLRLEERVVDGAAAVEWDVARRMTLRFSLLARWSDSNYDPFDYTKVIPSAAVGLMMTP